MKSLDYNLAMLYSVLYTTVLHNLSLVWKCPEIEWCTRNYSNLCTVYSHCTSIDVYTYSIKKRHVSLHEIGYGSVISAIKIVIFITSLPANSVRSIRYEADAAVRVLVIRLFCLTTHRYKYTQIYYIVCWTSLRNNLTSQSEHQSATTEHTQMLGKM